MDDSKRLLHPPQLNTIAGAADVDADHHCHVHSHFTATCKSCRRARAAFLPYRNVDPHPAAATRSFQSNLGPAFITYDIGLGEAVAFGIAEGATEGLIDGIFDLES